MCIMTNMYKNKQKVNVLNVRYREWSRKRKK